MCCSGKRLLMRTPVLLLVLFSLILLSACDTDRVSKLEKENSELKSQLASADLALQEKCSKAAKAWFRESFHPDKNTVLLDQTNHYNRKMNKCFIMVEYHYNSGRGPVGEPWYNDISLWDVFENSKYAGFTESHIVYPISSKLSPEDKVDHCDVAGTACKTLDEFNSLTRSYMND